MSVKHTSWQAYQDVLRGGVAKTQAEKILAYINHAGRAVTRSEIAKGADVTINAVSGRVKELLEADVIFVVGVGKCQVTGRTVEKLKVVEYE